jgi:putative ABC transport system ATP-binding protein
MIEFREVTKIFGSGATRVRAVNRLSFTCPQGAFLAITGPSGSGKSTILHLAAGLTPPTTGTVRVDGADVAAMTPAESALMRRRRVGYVLQTFDLMPFLTARANVAMPLVLDGVARREANARADEALALVDMVRRADHDPAVLSGGEQQRVAIARALVIRPALILADEPTGNLDRTAGRAIMDLFRDINERTGVTILLVTHDPVFAAYGQRILRLVDGALDQEMVLTEDTGPSSEAPLGVVK